MEVVVRDFQHLLSDSRDWRPSLNGLLFQDLKAQEVAWLEEPFSEGEVFNALLGFNEDKVPRLNHFVMAFWQFSWDFVKDEVMGLFWEFHELGSFEKSLNATFLDFNS